jgi:hypothetical protein
MRVKVDASSNHMTDDLNNYNNNIKTMSWPQQQQKLLNLINLQRSKDGLVEPQTRSNADETCHEEQP